MVEGVAAIIYVTNIFNPCHMPLKSAISSE